MSRLAMSTLHHVQVRFARTRQLIGWAGLAGLALMLTASLVFGLAFMAQSTIPTGLPALAVDSDIPTTAAGAPEAGPRTVPDLARPGDVPKLLRQLERIAVENGLGWAAADYRITPLSSTQTTGLEVRSTFKGPYPKLRSMVAKVLREVPASTLREFSVTRASSEQVDVEARLVFAVLLDGEPASAGELQISAPR